MRFADVNERHSMYPYWSLSLSLPMQLHTLTSLRTSVTTFIENYYHWVLLVDKVYMKPCFFSTQIKS